MKKTHYTSLFSKPFSVEDGLLIDANKNAMYKVMSDNVDMNHITDVLNNKKKQLDDISCYSDDGCILYELDGSFELILYRDADICGVDAPESVLEEMDKSIAKGLMMFNGGR